MTVGLAANVMFVVENALAERDDERRIWCSIVELCFFSIFKYLLQKSCGHRHRFWSVAVVRGPY